MIGATAELAVILPKYLPSLPSQLSTPSGTGRLAPDSAGRAGTFDLLAEHL